MRDISDFYQLVDSCFLECRNIKIQDAEHKLGEVLEEFADELECDEEFNNEARREIETRILILAIDKNLGLENCLERWRRVEKFEFDDAISRWLISCQVSRYLQNFKNTFDFRDTLISIKVDLETELKGLQETINQVSEELSTWDAIVSEDP